MSILAAQPLYRQEVLARSAGGTVRAMDDGAPTSATFVVSFDADPLGTGTAAIEGVDGGVIMTCTLPALEPDEGYLVRVTTNEGVVRDVLVNATLSPLGELVTLPEILAVRGALLRYIEQSAQRLQITPEQFAAEKAGQARGVLDDMIRKEVQKLESQYDRYRRRYVLSSRYGLTGYLRTRIIMDTDRLRRIERHLAVAEVLRAKIEAQDEEDASATLMTMHLGQASAALAAIGPLRIDIDGDGDEDQRTDVIGNRAIYHYRVTM